MELRPYQAEARQAVHAEWSAGHSRTLLVLPTGCHAKGERLLMADGTTKAVEEIVLGDRLLGADGKPRTVLHQTNGFGSLYRIVPVKGQPFTVTRDHNLTLVRTNERRIPKFPCQSKGGKIIDVPVSEWLNWSNNKKHLYKLVRSGPIPLFCDAPERELPVDPYFLGILLGDGDVKNTISVTTPDPEVVEELYAQAQKYNMHLRQEAAGQAKTYLFVSNDTSALGCRGSRLHQELTQIRVRRKGAAEKAVPLCYKTAYAPIRLEVLAGLLDSDGSYNGAGGFDFISKSSALAEDVAFLCRSVGLAAYVSTSTKRCGNFTGEYFRVSISGNCSIIPCRVKRKQCVPRRQKKDVLRTGFSVEAAGSGEYFGFTVDGDNRYLMSDFTITHNCGKTIVFAAVAEDCVRAGQRVLVLAHRGELLDQAADKIYRSTGLRCALEQARHSSLDSPLRITVGSVQSLGQGKRLAPFAHDWFGAIIIDEAHHAVTGGYRQVLDWFPQAQVLGVTATPDRGDMQNLGKVFDSLAYEYRLQDAIAEGYLCPILAQTIPLQLDLTGVGLSAGDFAAEGIDSALDPYLDQIAAQMETYCAGRRTVVFLPLIKTSQKFCGILQEHGFRAAEVNGQSPDRAAVLDAFAAGDYDVLCNSMLLTEGWDCPPVDCVVVLRPTKVRSLYSQMVGRGTRPSPGKKNLLLLDFLWMTDRHELCRPADLLCEDHEVAARMTETLAQTDGPKDISEAAQEAAADIVAQREEALAQQLALQRRKKARLVDPLQYEMSIRAEDLSGYVPAFGWEAEAVTDKQAAALEKAGINPDGVDSAGKASKLLDRLFQRQREGLATPKQIRCLEKYGFVHVGTWTFEAARNMIDRIAANGWRGAPRGVNPAAYTPPAELAGLAFDDLLEL